MSLFAERLAKGLRTRGGGLDNDGDFSDCNLCKEGGALAFGLLFSFPIEAGGVVLAPLLKLKTGVRAGGA